MTDDAMIAALLREREGYVQRGMDERVAQVDEQLRLRGHETTPGDQARTEAPKSRRAPRKDTT
ncbi:hypothetical protein [Nonomuraea typhae]|uniref:hypothetical protein n=1 Tax=Nonomuraea typhae TaxID=2603600 RepID=UPI0012FBBC5A|nr:hypothetical protein [Nonomuraea typhae]